MRPGFSYHSVCSVFPIFYSVEAIKELSSCRVVPSTRLRSLRLELRITIYVLNFDSAPQSVPAQPATVAKAVLL